MRFQRWLKWCECVWWSNLERDLLYKTEEFFTWLFASNLSTSERSRSYQQRTERKENKEEKRKKKKEKKKSWLVTCIQHFFATLSGLVRDVTGACCRAQNGSTRNFQTDVAFLFSFSFCRQSGTEIEWKSAMCLYIYIYGSTHYIYPYRLTPALRWAALRAILVSHSLLAEPAKSRSNSVNEPTTFQEKNNSRNRESNPRPSLWLPASTPYRPATPGSTVPRISNGFWGFG